jgi:hypothetical protein
MARPPLPLTVVPRARRIVAVDPPLGIVALRHNGSHATRIEGHGQHVAARRATHHKLFDGRRDDWRVLILARQNSAAYRAGSKQHTRPEGVNCFGSRHNPDYITFGAVRVTIFPAKSPVPASC